MSRNFESLAQVIYYIALKCNLTKIMKTIDRCQYFMDKTKVFQPMFRETLKRLTGNK
jgi:hypothetical protein